MPVVPATVQSLVSDTLVIRWAKGAPIGDVEGFLTYLLDSSGFGERILGQRSPYLEAEVGDGYCELSPGPDLWSMVLAEEVAAQLARGQSGEVLDGNGRVLATVSEEDSHPWAALEAAGVISLFRPRPPDVPDMNAHPLIPLDDCKISGVSFNEEQECVLDVYFDYWARPCAFLVEDDQESVLLYRPMYRFRQALLATPGLCKLTVTAPPTSRVYGALGVKGYKVDRHKVDKRYTWSIKGQGQAFSLRIRTEEAWLTRSLPVWYVGDRLLLGPHTDHDFTTDELLHRKEQHWDMVDSVWGQEWYVAAKDDGTLNPFGRIYKADPTSALLDLPGLKPKEG